MYIGIVACHIVIPALSTYRLQRTRKYTTCVPCRRLSARRAAVSVVFHSSRWRVCLAAIRLAYSERFEAPLKTHKREINVACK